MNFTTGKTVQVINKNSHWYDFLFEVVQHGEFFVKVKGHGGEWIFNEKSLMLRLE